MSSERYLCIHGHFYQPPRENPWLEAVEQQDSAAPYHDWNERVTAECYTPNTATRILDSANRIAKIVSNYASISFNFGPTLLSWMERKAPDTYRAIQEADRASRERFSGHGSALAQCYNHAIMPLASTRDKVTQVRWGIADFRRRFGRDPEGMWLPETAVDLETLDVLAQHGIQFTVLAPSQAKSVDGKDVSGERIDPSRAYRQQLPSGLGIDLLFYDGPVSRAVAFERLLDNGEAFARRLLDAFSEQRDWPQLSHIATDGETYGHHHSFGDMALAYALDHIASSGLARITNYGEFLELHPPEHEVEIIENTSWSCAHGVGRWRRNCGCNSGAHADWNQEWRAPLRAALDWLRDEIAPRYEEVASHFLKSPWAARNDYIDVILDRTPEGCQRFAAEHFRRKHLKHDEQVQVWKLLEMQRHALLMYTSCGWFFDELSGLEAVQVMQYAGRVVQLAQELFGEAIEKRFLEKLALAKSNIAEHRDGAQIYRKFVKPAVLDAHKLAAHYAINSLFENYAQTARIYCYSAEAKDFRVKRSGQMRLAFGHVRLSSEITRETGQLMFGVLHFGDHNLHGGVAPFHGEGAYRDLVKSAREAFGRGDWGETMRRLDQGFGGHTYSLKHLFRDEQRQVLAEVLASSLERSTNLYQQMYRDQAALLRFVRECGFPIPNQMRATAELALNSLLRQALAAPELNLAGIQRLLEEAHAAGVTLDQKGLELLVRRHVEASANHFFEDARDVARLVKFRDVAAAARSLPLPLVLWSVQNRCYEALQKLYPEMLAAGRDEWAALFRDLAGLLSLRVEENES